MEYHEELYWQRAVQDPDACEYLLQRLSTPSVTYREFVSGPDQRPVLVHMFNIHSIAFCYLASVTLTTAISLSGHTEVVISLISQLRIVQCSHECFHMGEVAAECHVSQMKRKL